VTPCTVTGDLTGVQFGVDPELEPLGAWGGPTWTHALGGSSPAIDAGDPAGCTDYSGAPLPQDQRGAPRVGVCDLGAFELAMPLFADGFESGDTNAWSSTLP
jgi:hypothetical protein